MLDTGKLKSLMDGDENMVRRFLEIFKTQTPEQLSRLKQFIDAESWEQVSITAHAIKSQCRYLGLDNLAGQASEIEQLTEKEEQLDLVLGLVVQLEEGLNTVLKTHF